MFLIFIFGTPKYIGFIHATHNANIDLMVGTVKIWSSEQALESLRDEGSMAYPLPNSIKIDNVVKEGNFKKWDDSNPNKWEYIAGGGIELIGDGSYLKVRPIYIN